MAITKERHDAGRKDLYRLCVEKGEKELSSLLKTTWRIHTAADVLRQANTPRIDKVKTFLSAKCVDQFNGYWLVCAKQMLCQYNFDIQSNLYKMDMAKTET